MDYFDNNLEKNHANYVPLTPLSFLQRAKDIYPNYEALIYEDRHYTWDEVYKRVTKFASALEKIGIKKGDTVSFLAFNTPEIFEAHYSVPMTGAVLNTINIRLLTPAQGFEADQSVTVIKSTKSLSYVSHFHRGVDSCFSIPQLILGLLNKLFLHRT